MVNKKKTKFCFILRYEKNVTSFGQLFVIDHNGECPNQYQLFTKTNQYQGEYPYGV